MLGAIIGDVVGSRYEAANNKNPRVPLLAGDSTYTDDTVCTIATARWLLDGGAYAVSLREIAGAHYDRGFGAKMVRWLVHAPTDHEASWGNGSAMRVSPIALWARSEEEALALAEESALPTHGHPDAVIGAQATVWAMRHAFAHRDPQRLLEDAQRRWPYADLVSRDPVTERATHEFDITAKGTVPLAIVLAARSGSFEATLRNAISMGGDADTLAAIAGGIAEGLYGLDKDLGMRVMRLPEFWYDPRLQDTVCAFHAHTRVVDFYTRHGLQVPDVASWVAQGPTFGPPNLVRPPKPAAT